MTTVIPLPAGAAGLRPSRRGSHLTTPPPALPQAASAAPEVGLPITAPVLGRTQHTADSLLEPLGLTLVGPDARALATCTVLAAAIDDPHALVPAFLQMTPEGAHLEDYQIEVRRLDDREVVYVLRCRWS